MTKSVIFTTDGVAILLVILIIWMIVPRRHNLLILVVLVCSHAVHIQHWCSCSATTSSKHSVWRSCPQKTGLRFISLIVRWRTRWINICLLTLFNQHILILFLQPCQKKLYEEKEERRLASVTRTAHSIAYPARPSDSLRRLVRVNALRPEGEWILHHITSQLCLSLWFSPARPIPPKPTALAGISPSVSSEVGMLKPYSGL